MAAAEETDGFTASQHIEVLAEHAPRLRLDVVLADERYVGRDRHLRTYVANLGGTVHVARMGVRDGSARHDPLLLASALADVLDV
mgnify:CR=1 FL=1